MDIVAKIATLQARWLTLTNRDMPDEIARMPLEVIERKLALLQDVRYTCFLPSVTIPVQAVTEEMQQWDAHGDGPLNSYGAER
jgi:hypothetical protein